MFSLSFSNTCYKPVFDSQVILTTMSPHLNLSSLPLVMWGMQRCQEDWSQKMVS